MITNMSINPTSPEAAQASAVRKTDGGFPGYTLMFCACPQCGARMEVFEHGARQFALCPNHQAYLRRSGFIPFAAPAAAQVELKPAVLVYRHHVRTGLLELVGVQNNSQHVPTLVAVYNEDGSSDENDYKGFYPLTAPAGSIT